MGTGHPACSPLQGKAAGAGAATVRSRFWPALQMNWRVWTPVQFINVNYVPLQVSQGTSASAGLSSPLCTPPPRTPPRQSEFARVCVSPRSRTPPRRGPGARVARALGPHTCTESRGGDSAERPRLGGGRATPAPAAPPEREQRRVHECGAPSPRTARRTAPPDGTGAGQTGAARELTGGQRQQG